MAFRKEMQQKEAQMAQLARDCYSWLEPRLASSHVPLYFEAASSALASRYFERIGTTRSFTPNERALRLFGAEFPSEAEARYSILYAQAVARTNLALQRTGKKDIFDATITHTDDASFVADQIRRKAIDICGQLGALDAGVSAVEIDESRVNILRTQAGRAIGLAPGKEAFHAVADQVETLLAHRDRQDSLRILANSYSEPNPPVFIILPSHIGNNQQK